jgi:hypothetical protein
MNDDEMLQKAQEGWRPPEGLLGSAPRESSLTGAGRAMVALAFVFFLGAIAAGIGLQTLTRDRAEAVSLIRERGVTTQAIVTRLWRGGDKSHQPWVAYRFEADGLVYGAQRKLSLKTWSRLEVGSGLEVVYVPSKPELNYPRGHIENPIPAFVPYLAAVILGSTGILLLFAVRRERRLLEDGRAAPGVVTELRKRARSHGAAHEMEFRYTFALLSGSTGKGRGRRSRNPPPIGSTICVLYDPDYPSRNAPYPFSLVRPRRE